MYSRWESPASSTALRIVVQSHDISRLQFTVPVMFLFSSSAKREGAPLRARRSVPRFVAARRRESEP